MTPRRVRFAGQELWFHTSDRRVGGPLYLLGQCDEIGEPLDYEQPAYAHVYSDKKIRRADVVIGHKGELEEANTTPPVGA